MIAKGVSLFDGLGAFAASDFFSSRQIAGDFGDIDRDRSEPSLC